MTFRIAAIAFLLLGVNRMPGSAQAQEKPPELVASTEHRTPEEERAGFRLPPGFVIELVAAEPDIQKPMNLAFDARGRLWVTSSIEYPYPPAKGEKSRDHVTILDDFAPDGRARSITVFADNLTIPIGVLPLREETLVHSIPYIHRLKDNDHDGKSDQDDELYGTYGYTDTHGMTSAFTWGFDGWIYACHGFSNTSTVKDAEGRLIRMQSGNVYRFLPDGSHIEQVTWGQVNPFGLSFDPRGDLFSVDCHSRPIMMLLREGYYSSFGKPHDGLGFAPEIMSHDHGSTGIAGIVYYAASQFPAAFRDRVFIGNVVTSRVNMDSLKWSGSSPKAIAEPDFIVSDDPWFRPVDIELGPDGCLYIADFYNKIIGHYEVPLEHPGRDRTSGRIWRVRYEGGEPHAPARSPIADWNAATTAELIAALGHGNLAVRIRAANELSERGGSAEIAAARQARSDPSSALRRVHGLWVSQRLAVADDTALYDAAMDRERVVRIHAMKVLGEQPALSSVQRALAIRGLNDPNAFVRRAAAEALARHASEANLGPLLAARDAASDEDPQLVHGLRIALRDQLRDVDLWPRFTGGSFSEADLRTLADVAVGVHQVEAARFLLGHLQRFDESRFNILRFTQHIARYGDEATDGALLAWLRGREADPIGEQAELVKALFQGNQGRGVEFSGDARAWAVTLARRAFETAGKPAIAIDLATTIKLKEVRPEVEAIARDSSARTPLRNAAMGGLPAIDPDTALDPLAVVLDDASSPIELREHAANLIGQIARDKARDRLAASLPTVPARVQTAIALALAGTRGGADRLLLAVSLGKASPRLLQERAVDLRMRRARIKDYDKKLAELTKDLQPIEKTIQELLDRRRKGFDAAKTDAKVGAEMFTKHCASCHQMAGEGAKIGPQLDGIGVRGAERLLEDILDPNRNVDQTFRASTFALNDGRVVTGLVQREEGDVLVIADNQGKEVRVPKETIEERTVTPLSLMPANLAEQVPDGEFYDLLAYLLSRREGAVKAP